MIRDSQRRQLPEHNGATGRGGMGLAIATPPGSRARGHVEPLVDRARNVQAHGPQRHTPAGDNHGGVHVLRPDPRLVVQHQGRPVERRRPRERQAR